MPKCEIWTKHCIYKFLKKIYNHKEEFNREAQTSRGNLQTDFNVSLKGVKDCGIGYKVWIPSHTCAQANMTMSVSSLVCMYSREESAHCVKLLVHRVQAAIMMDLYAILGSQPTHSALQRV